MRIWSRICSYRAHSPGRFWYITLDDLREGVQRSRRAFKAAGAVGVAGAASSFVGGLLALADGMQAAMVLAIGTVLWLIATR